MSASADEATLLPLPDEGAGTGWFVYGVTSRSASVPDGLRGVDGQPLHLLVHGELAAVASAAHLDRPAGRRAEILAYSEVLDTLAPGRAVAPVRFGSLFADDQDVVDHLLAPGREELTSLLAELEGCVQYRLSATYRQDALLAAVVADDPEIAELRELTRDAPEESFYGERVRLGQLVSAAVEQRRAVDTERLVDAISPLCVALSESPGQGLDGVVDAALLVEVTRVEVLEEALEVMAETVHDRIGLRLLGPMAPYDFVGGEPWD